MPQPITSAGGSAGLTSHCVCADTWRHMSKSVSAAEPANLGQDSEEDHKAVAATDGWHSKAWDFSPMICAHVPVALHIGSAADGCMCCRNS